MRGILEIELNIVTPMAKSILHTIEAQPILIDEIHIAQTTNPQLERIREKYWWGKHRAL